MEFSELAQFIDYKEMYRYIKSTHLEEYPTVKEYAENYLLIPFETSTDAIKNNIKAMYSFLTSPGHDDFVKSLDICLETSFINSDKQILEIAFIQDNSTNDESGFNADYNLWVFAVDVEIGCFKKYIFEH